jgi:PEGA domain
MLLGTALTMARAAGADDADQLIREGIELRRRGDEAAALKRFEAAYTLVKTPRAQAQIGFAQQALGLWGEADRNLREALASADDWIRKNRSVIEAALQTIAEHVGTLEMVGTPAGAEALVNGEKVGALPMKVNVTIGDAVVEIRAAGYLTVRRNVTIWRGASFRERFDLQRVTPAPADGPAGASPYGEPPRSKPSEDRASSAASATREGAWRGPAIWGTAIGAGASLAFGIGESLVGLGKVNSFNDGAECNKYLADRGSERCGALYDEGQNARLASYVGYGVAGALAATSLVLYLTRPKALPKEALVCAPKGQLGVSCSLSF